MADDTLDAKKIRLEQRRLKLEENRLVAEKEQRDNERNAREVSEQAQSRQATFDRRYRLLELKERKADRALKLRELEFNQGRGIRFTSAQATVAAALLAVFSAVIGGAIQGWVTRDVEASKSQALISVERLKAQAGIDLEVQRQKAAEKLDRVKFETTLILKAIEAAKRDDQIRNLKFFINAGFISDDEGKIAKIDEGAYPALPPVSASTPADFYRDYKGAVGLLDVKGFGEGGGLYDRRGTSFIITKDGYALTAAHLFDDFRLRPNGKPDMDVTVQLGSASVPAQAEVIKLDKDFDLALIKLSGNIEYGRTKISREQISIGEFVILMSYPLVTDQLTVLLDPVFSLDENGRIGLALPTSPGQAGSPVFNRNGDVVAILVGEIVGTVGRAVPVRFARPLLLASGVE